jgi:hypothetical protein
MQGVLNNMPWEVYLENLLISDNLGLNISNNVNYEYKIANDGSALLNNYSGDLARHFSFKIFSIMGDEFNTKNDLFEKLLELNKKGSLSFVCLDDNSKSIRCNVNIIKYSLAEDIDEDSVVFDVELIEVKPEDNTVVSFNTFNYKPATVSAPAVSTNNVLATQKALVACNISFGCSIKNNTCVKYLQTLLSADGFYKGSKDGSPCTSTFNAFKQWQQKKAKIKVTGKFDATTKNYLKKRWKI